MVLRTINRASSEDAKASMKREDRGSTVDHLADGCHHHQSVVVAHPDLHDVRLQDLVLAVVGLILGLDPGLLTAGILDLGRDQ